MKICILSERMKLGYGVDLVVDQQAQRLVALGHDVTVVVLHADVRQPERPYRMQVINRHLRLADAPTRSAAEKVILHFGLSDVDLWMLHTPPFYEWLRYLPGPALCIEYGAPPGHFFPETLGRQIDDMRLKRQHGLYGELLPCDAIMSISHALHEELPRSNRARSTVIHLGCDHYEEASAQTAAHKRRTLGIAEDECLILWVGRMQMHHDEQPYKGLQELLKIIPLIRQQAPKARFVLAGKVSNLDKSRLEQMGLIVLQNLSDSEMTEAYAAADILLNLSRWEGFNLALLEAQFQGTPAVAYHHGPHPEIVRHGETGLLVPTSGDIVTEVARLANDEALRHRLGQQAREFARSFTWDASVAKLVPVMEACVAAAPDRKQITGMRSAAARSADDRRPVAVELLNLEKGAFIRLAFLKVFGRPADPIDEGFWLRRLMFSRSKAETLLAMVRDARSMGGEPAISGMEKVPAIARLDWLRSLPAYLTGIGAHAHKMPWTDLSDAAFIQFAYLTRLGRAVEAPALEGWGKYLAEGHTRYEFFQQIDRSEEARNFPIKDPHIERFLAGELVRPPAASLGLDLAWKIRDLRWTLGVPKSSEWRAMNPEAFVSRAYRLLLRREASEAEVRGWLRRLKAGGSRESILHQIRYSAEGRRHTLRDPELRALMIRTSLRRSALVRAVLGDPDRKAASIAARMVDPVSERVDAIPEPVSTSPAALEGAQPERSDSRESVKVGEQLCPAEAYPSGCFSLNGTHVALAAAGAQLRPNAFLDLQNHAEVSGSDVIYGDEYLLSVATDEVTVRRLGPFSHLGFLQSPDLGGVVAVRRDLLDDAGISPRAALSGAVRLKLIEAAHTVTYVPQAFSGRKPSDILSSRPSVDDMRDYSALMGRNDAVIAETAYGFSLRFPKKSHWRAAVVVVAGAGGRRAAEADVSHLERIAPDRIHASLVDFDEAVAGEEPIIIQEGLGRARLSFATDCPYSKAVNQAISHAPEDCSIIIVMDANVVPQSPDWLERLVELALEPEIGAVAPKTLYSDGRIRHAGLSVAEDELRYVARFNTDPDIGHANAPTSADALAMTSEVAAVSRHCLAMRRQLFVDLQGFDEGLGRDTADAEMCLRLRERGFKVMVCGETIMIAPDAFPRWGRQPPAAELAKMYRRHEALISRDRAIWLRGVGQGSRMAVEGRTEFLPPVEMR